MCSGRGGEGDPGAHGGGNLLRGDPGRYLRNRGAGGGWNPGDPPEHREDFHVFTGHISHEGGEGLSGDYSLYAKLPGTLIFLMGLSNLEEIVKRLMDGGKDGETPAAVVTDGTLSRMRVVRASLKDLPEAVRKAGMTPPGIIAVGEVCAFHFTSMVPGVLTGITVGVHRNRGR